MNREKKVVRVLVVDDSAVVRKVICRELERFPDIEIVGTAVDPYVARDKIVKLRPDVITLDMEMPRMDGLSFFGTVDETFSLPVVVLSSLTPKNSETALKALDLGAIEVLCKPGEAYSTKDIAGPLVRAIRAAAAARIESGKNSRIPAAKVSMASTGSLSLLKETTHKVVAIGASTGGTKAIEAVLTCLPATTPGIVIVQHMPENFTTSFAQRLNEICRMEVREAKDNDHVVPGVALIAPGNFHMVLRRSGAKYLVRIKDGPRVHYQRPAVDVLFQSVAKVAGKNAVGAILTGMGADGAKGLLSMHDVGAFTLAQDEATCIVFGMPKEAIKLGGVDAILPLQRIPHEIVKALQK